MYGQDRPRAASKRAQRHQTDTLNTVVNRDSLTVADSLAAENKRKMLEMTASPDLKEQPVPTDSLQKAIDPKRWVPNPTKPPGLPRHSRRWTNLQPQVLETAHLLWRICRLCLCPYVEQQDV